MGRTRLRPPSFFVRRRNAGWKVRGTAHMLRSAVTGDVAPQRTWVGRRERRGPKGASNRESTPEADELRMAQHGAYKEAEQGGHVGHP